MKIIKKLYIKNSWDKSKKSIIDVSSKRLKKIKNEFNKKNNFCLEIEGEYYTLQKMNEKHECEKCYLSRWCGSPLHIQTLGYNCLSFSITKNEYYIFRKVAEYEIVFGDDEYE